MEYEINSVSSGRLHAERDGLYWNLTATCARDWDHPIRIIAETANGRVTLGVPMPEGDTLHLSARISDRQCPFTADTRITTDQEPEPAPEPEPESEPEPAEAAQALLPFEPEKPFERIADFPAMHVVEQDGKLYWQPPQDAPGTDDQP